MGSPLLRRLDGQAVALHRRWRHFADTGCDQRTHRVCTFLSSTTGQIRRRYPDAQQRPLDGTRRTFCANGVLHRRPGQQMGTYPERRTQAAPCRRRRCWTGSRLCRSPCCRYSGDRIDRTLRCSENGYHDDPGRVSSPERSPVRFSRSTRITTYRPSYPTYRWDCTSNCISYLPSSYRFSANSIPC